MHIKLQARGKNIVHSVKNNVYCTRTIEHTDLNQIACKLVLNSHIQNTNQIKKSTKNLRCLTENSIVNIRISTPA